MDVDQWIELQRQLLLIRHSFCKIEKNDAGRVADGGAMAREVQPAGFAVHPE
jgi:hypothetical protein